MIKPEPTTQTTKTMPNEPTTKTTKTMPREPTTKTILGEIDVQTLGPAVILGEVALRFGVRSALAQCAAVAFCMPGFVSFFA